MNAAPDVLIGTTEHSVLGRRWVYDACADPVYVRALATVILTGGSQAELLVVTGDGCGAPGAAAETMVQGSGVPGREVPDIGYARPTDSATATVIDAGLLEAWVLRLLGARARLPAPMGTS